MTNEKLLNSTWALCTCQFCLLCLFGKRSIVKRLLIRHGDSDREKIFRIEQDTGGKWFMKGVHPLVPTSSPNPRPSSKSFESLREDRTPCAKSSSETNSMVPDAIESLHKASQSSSSLVSSSPKADMGTSSIKYSIPINTPAEISKEMIAEMEINSLVMDKLRFITQSSILLMHVISRLHATLPQSMKSIIVKSRYKINACAEVCSH